MLSELKKIRQNLLLIGALTAAVVYFAYFNLSSAVFYDPDSYYNIAVSGFIRHYGLHYHFHWARFSIFNTTFADKDLLLHLISLPFLFLSKDPVTAGKYALLFCVLIFFLSYSFILKHYLKGWLTAVFILAPLSSSVFSTYMLQLRSVIIANSLLMLGAFCLIRKKSFWLLIISALLALCHGSFLVFALFAGICEGLRYAMEKEFYWKNILAVVIGSISALLLHPDFPNNFLILYLNSIIVPLDIVKGINLGFSGELLPFNTKFLFINNFALFFCSAAVIWAMALARKRAGFASVCWLALFSIFLLLAVFSARYWFQATFLGFIFCASYYSDLRNEEKQLKPAIKFPLIGLGIAAFLIFTPLNLRQLQEYRSFLAENSAAREKAGRWMGKHIPAGETIYHSYWDDSAYFLCLNPKNDYINIGDPIYMFYAFPKESGLLEDLSLGRTDKPYAVIARIFKADYGYLRKNEPLLRQAVQDPEHFKIIYEDNGGTIFKIWLPPRDSNPD